MKKQYSKPVVTRIALNYQQAVLAACAIGTTSRANDRSPFNCTVTPTCRRSSARGGDSTSAS